MEAKAEAKDGERKSSGAKGESKADAAIIEEVFDFYVSSPKLDDRLRSFVFEPLRGASPVCVGQSENTDPTVTRFLRWSSFGTGHVVHLPTDNDVQFRLGPRAILSVWPLKK